MAINIKSAAAEGLVRQLADRTGESITDAVEIAVRERLERLRAVEEFEQYASGVRRVQQRLRERPVIDARTADEIVGYDEFGAPTNAPALAPRPSRKAASPKRPQAEKSKVAARRGR